MSIIKRLKWKDKSGKTTDYDLGAKASNVEQDATHRFVSDTEKQTWNGKADPGDIPSGAAADYGVANNDTTNRADMLSTAQVAYQHGKEIDQLNSEIASMKVSFQDGCNAIYQACVNNGVTPSSNSPDAIVAAIEKISSNVVAEFCSRKFAMGMSETLTGSGLAGDIYILFSTGATTGTSLNVTGGSVIHSSNASYSGSNGAIWTIRSTAENISVTIKSDDKTLMRLAR